MHPQSITLPPPAEEWRVSPLFPLYEVSNWGRVRRRFARTNTQAGRLLKPGKNRHGYLSVRPMRDGQSRTESVHVLVADAFIGPRPTGLVINHRDGVKTHNWPSNLEYCTHSHDRRHAYAMGLNRGHPKLTAAQILALRAAYEAGDSQDVLAARFQVPQSTIKQILRGTRYRRMQERLGLTFETTAQIAAANRRRGSTVAQDCPTCGRTIHGVANWNTHQAIHQGIRRRLNLSPEQRQARSDRTREQRRKALARLLAGKE